MRVLRSGFCSLTSVDVGQPCQLANVVRGSLNPHARAACCTSAVRQPARVKEQHCCLSFFSPQLLLHAIHHHKTYNSKVGGMNGIQHAQQQQQQQQQQQPQSSAASTGLTSQLAGE
jgi:hypothetical protein